LSLRGGTLAVYEAAPDFASAPNFADRELFLAVRFIKSMARQLGGRATHGDDIEPKRRLSPFTLVGGLSGVFVTGDMPLWLLASDQGPARLLESAQKGVFSFSSFDGHEHPNGFALGTREVRPFTAVHGRSVF
jgi:hypothetical protein